METTSRRVLLFLLLSVFIVPVFCQDHDNLHGNHAQNGERVNPKFKPILEHHGAQLGTDKDAPGVHQVGVNQELLRQQRPLGSGKVQEGQLPKGRPKHFPQFKLSEQLQCREDIKKFCNPKIADNNFEVIDCLQSDEKIADEVSIDCQHLLWNYKKNLTKDDRFEMVANDVCKDDLPQLQECNQLPKGSGQIIPCLVDNYQSVQAKECRRYLEKMSKIVFSDYSLIYKFADACHDDIQRFTCGRLETVEKEDSVHRQGAVLECLVRNITKLSQQCKHQLLRVAELQSDDYHMDRPLYYACRDAREHFCQKTPSGNGRVYECLFKHKMDPDMPIQCKEKLQRRQREIAEDVKVEKKFYVACRKDIQKYECFKHGQTKDPDTKRATVLICLEDNMKQDAEITPECLAEMNEVRQTLLSDYKINPELIANCEHEIKACLSQDNDDKLEEGQVVHCLMDKARTKSRKKAPDNSEPMSPQCQRAVEDLLLEADVGSNFQMDKVLMKACMPVVQTACRNIQAGDARILNCLMEKIDDDVMTDECEERLMEIQYFVMRDWRLDNQLYQKCRRYAKDYCGYKGKWLEKTSKNDTTGQHVMSCLYRHMRDQKQQQLSRACKHEMKRVMRNRARKIELDPEIEENCVTDLGRLCSDQEKDIAKGDELSCLQDNYDELTEACANVVGNITEDEDTYLDLDVVLVKSCTPMLKLFCSEELEEEEDEDVVMQCLIQHKHHQKMDPKCYAGIEHHQLISMKNYEFSHKFKEACKKSVKQFCPNVKRKGDVVTCLSEHVRNDTLRESEHRIDKSCRRQLRFESMQRGEDIKLDEKLDKACTDDVQNFCSKVKHGNAKVIECLKAHQQKLSKRCHKVLFKREKEEVKLDADYKLHHVCKGMIKQYCTDGDPDIVTCLVGHKHDPNFDASCREILVRRQITKNRDYRLNPTLRKECSMDIRKFCTDIVERAAPDQEMSGQVILCLRRQFVKKNLSGRCTDVIRDVIKESAMNYMEDVALANACESEIKQHCDPEHQKALQGAGERDSNSVLQMSQDDSKGEVQQCLMNKFKERLIKNTECKQQIARIIQESEIDINIDPILHTACQKDLHKFCTDVEAGEGRKMTCLLQEYEDHPNRLDKRCHEQLKRRKDLWEMSVQVAPVESVNELVAQISSSPAKTYLLGVICSIIGVIFLIGITCGRVTKRVSKENKMK
ncbi:Golgi apparatus protein 1-like isoform X2 [Mytilus californianus]|uniref:Golgi apparatus protein 1-like isoform X2 n=1 Tax=Mytilus californianus TaxID=6549 RepID=UPI0022463966|nr:Golgi apparatus protein 1-like isoform X2 [Mytilus californianus]